MSDANRVRKYRVYVDPNSILEYANRMNSAGYFITSVAREHVHFVRRPDGWGRLGIATELEELTGFLTPDSFVEEL